MIEINNRAYKVFDVHTHAFPDAIAKRAILYLAEKGGVSYFHDGSFGSLSEYEKKGGADGFLFLPIATKPSQTHSVNEWAVHQALLAQHVGECVLAFGSLHPKCENIDEELDFVVNNGLKGIKLHPEYQEFFVDDEDMFPIYQKIFQRGLIISFHAGHDLGFEPPVRGSAKRIAVVCDRFPDARIIAAHMGGFMQYDEVCEHLAGRENLWLDTSFAAQRMESEEIVNLIRLHGSKRVMFGTDAPWAKFEDSCQAIINSGLLEEELEDVLYNNASRLLKF